MRRITHNPQHTPSHHMPLRPRPSTSPLLTCLRASALLMLLASCASAQQQGAPRVGYAYPAGGKQGTTFEVQLGGQFLTGVSDVYVSGNGISAKVLEHVKPLSIRDANLLRDRMTELQDKRAAALGRRPASTQPLTQPASRPVWTSDDQKELDEIREKLIKYAPRQQANQALVETVRLEVKVAGDADTGEHVIRLRTPQGLTNPLLFCVGQLSEITPPAAPPSRDPRSPAGQPTGGAPSETAAVLPATLNGQIMPGERDRFRFSARKGQRIVAAVNARSLIPYIADAVPGWFQATLALYDARGKELAYDDDFRFNPDPVLCYLIPADGEYLLEIHDSIYRGREDFVYRIALGELPFVTSVFPLGSPVGPNASIEVAGWNLAASRITRLASRQGVRELWVNRDRLESNRFPFALDTLPEAAESEPNDERSRARILSLPVIVNGRIDKPGDADCFQFSGKTGDRIVAEVTARRLNSPLDSILRLTDASGREIASNDDFVDKAEGLSTHHADSVLMAQLPAPGTYYLHLTDVQRKGGAEYGYRLRVSAAMPDYELRIVPSSVNLRPGQGTKLTAYAVRKDGFTGEITLSLKDLPAGFRLGNAKIPADKDQAEITLTAPPLPTREPLPAVIVGSANIQGRTVTHEAVPADDMMQAFAYRHLVPAPDLLVAVAGRGMQRRPEASPAATRPAGQGAPARPASLPIKPATQPVRR